MEVINDFWQERANATAAPPDESMQALAAEALVEPPTLPPTDLANAGLAVMTTGESGAAAPWHDASVGEWDSCVSHV